MRLESIGSDSKKHFCIVLDEGSSLQSQATDIGLVGDCPACCRWFSSIPVLYPLDTRSTSPVVKTITVYRRHQNSLHLRTMASD